MLQGLPPLLGHALRDTRAGLDKLAINRLGTQSPARLIEVTSTAFTDHAFLPERYTADGQGMFPPLRWGGLPEGSTCAVLLVEDADSPTPLPWVHAIVVDLVAPEGSLAEGALSDPRAIEEAEALVGRNSMLTCRWLPPDPPPGHGPHRYAFQVFALAHRPDWSDEPGRDEILQALETGALASGCCVGLYQRGSIPVDPLAPAAVVT